jgi:transcriptional regulator with XRE-family HTH domain
MEAVDVKEQGRRVRAARAYAGLSNEDLAERTGIGRSTLVKTESGKRQARKWELWAIAEICGVPREFFESEELSITGRGDDAGDVEELEALADDDGQGAARPDEQTPGPPVEAAGGDDA